MKKTPGLVLVLWLCVASAAMAEPHRASIDITANQAGPVINKYLYGQFAEHLGHGIYGGIWVGEDSEIPNTRGFRNDVVDALKAIKVPLVRWPGGCFADEYHWRDGIGPRENRPVKVNTNWGGVEETNAFGTHEFFDFLELIGADAYVNGNIGSGTVREMSEWVEYMTSDKQSTLANERRRNGREEPWDIEFFGIGNETWGCGGNMRAQYYADLYLQYATFIKAPPGKLPGLVASGLHGDSTEWTEVLSERLPAGFVAGISHHYYTLPTGEWDRKGDAIGFDEDAWLSTLEYTTRIDGYLAENIGVLDRNDPDSNISLYLDEWGTWYDTEPGREPGFLYQQNTLRDAVVAALNFNIFHKHARRLHMTNIAQMVNVLQAMILTDGARMVLTPTYHAFDLYQVFHDATTLPFTIESTRYGNEEKGLPAVSASVARGKDGKLYLALVNTDPVERAIVSVQVADGEVTEVSGRILSAATMDARNTFENPVALVPRAFTAPLEALELPPKSLVVAELR